MVIKNKKILVTGGNGFIGSHLVEKLLKFTPHIIVASKALESNSYFVNRNLHKKVIFEPVDITRKNEVFNLQKNHKIDFVFHLAAQTLVKKGYDNPYDNFNTNIMGTVNLLELVRIKKIKGIIIASSDKAYGKSDLEYSENFPLKGDHPYDVSKSSADLIAQTYFKTYKSPVVITRVGNVYGPGDIHFSRIIPGICKSIIQNNVFKIRSNGLFVRDYLYIDAVVEGYILLMKHFSKIKGESFNFSSGDSLSVLDIIKKIGSICNKDIKYKIENKAINEIPYQHLNDEKIKKFGWKNNYTFNNSFKKTLKWYEEYFGQ
jgi:CDP-glucose 4,6-dehydratase